jgi:UPF0042 nucleotide-binding protein
MSGAGKTTVLKFLEDIGFYCADNLPPSLLARFVETCFGAEDGNDRLALGIDIRGGKLFGDLLPAIDELRAFEDCAVSVLYLDCGDETLHRRYKETRRSHPLARSGSLMEGILAERKMTRSVREQATYVIDTSSMLARELKAEINSIFLSGKAFAGIIVHVISFGFKHGLPMDADMVLDVRFLPNPFYVEELKFLSGNDPPVRDYVLSFPASRSFIDKTCDILDLLMPHYIIEGKTRLVICVGCTGGKHRSVTLANSLGEYLRSQGYSAYISHRDISNM